MKIIYTNTLFPLYYSYLDTKYIDRSPTVHVASCKCGHGPLLDISGALWVLLQGLHDLAVVQHQPHELVLPLSFGRGAINGSDEFQLLQMFKGLETTNTGGFKKLR